MMNFLQRLVALRPAVPSEIDGSLSCFYCNADFFSSTDEYDASKHAPDCLYVEASKALAYIASGNGCAAHGLAHPCEACAAELPLHDALQQIADMDPAGQRADDLGRAARIARDAIGANGSGNG